MQTLELKHYYVLKEIWAREGGWQREIEIEREREREVTCKEKQRLE